MDARQYSASGTSRAVPSSRVPLQWSSALKYGPARTVVM